MAGLLQQGWTLTQRTPRLLQVADEHRRDPLAGAAAYSSSQTALPKTLRKVTHQDRHEEWVLEPQFSFSNTRGPHQFCGFRRWNSIRLYSEASLPRAEASTRTPKAISAGLAYSSGRWLTPPRQGMKIIAIGAMSAMSDESW